MKENKISKGKRGMMKFRGNQRHAFKSSLPVEIHRTHSIPPATNFDNTHGMQSTSEVHQTQCSKFLLELLTQAHSAYYIPKFQASRKAGIHIVCTV